jgi:hypothetical protein
MPVRALEELRCAARLARDLPGFLSTPIDAAGARDRVERQVKARGQRFLDMLKESVFAHPESPYRRVLDWMGCELGDIRGMVEQDGVEGALQRLAAEGFYFTFDQFKARRPMVLGSREFSFRDSDFNNPRYQPHFILWTGGSRSPAMQVPVSLEFVEEMAVSTVAGLEANGLSRHRHAYWLLSTALTLALRQAKLGHSPVAWFYPVGPIPWKGKVAAHALALLAGALGRPLPKPRFHDLADGEGMARWLERERAAGPILLTCYASSMVRICGAARELGIDLADVCFVTFGEPYTEAKQQIVAGAGARTVSHYGFTEGGLAGYSCANPVAPDDVHLFEHTFALVTRPVHGIHAFLLTSLTSSAPKIMLNVEPGDYGVIEHRPCGCRLERIGLTRHIHTIRSYEKLTGEGMTFVKSDLLRILEQVLPARFGGSAADYQLVEAEDEAGIVRLTLVISPRVGPVEEQHARELLLEELRRDGGPSVAGSQAWERGGTVRIHRGEPTATAAGKVLPFHRVRGPGA